MNYSLLAAIRKQDKANRSTVHRAPVQMRCVRFHYVTERGTKPHHALHLKEEEETLTIVAQMAASWRDELYNSCIWFVE